MHLHHFNDMQVFCQHTQPYLLKSKAEHNLLLGIVHTLIHHPNQYADLPYLVTVEADEQILAIAIRTTPYKLVLSKAADLAALKLIVQDLHQTQVNLPGVSGLVSETQAFVAEWRSLTGQDTRLVMEMGIHQLTQVEPIPMVQGSLRVATESDRPLLLEWYAGFLAEIGDVVRQSAEQMVDHGLKQQSIYLWQVDLEQVDLSLASTPVSLTCGSQSLPGAARIGPVYTPVQYRRQGYASACVAALSQHFLDQGCQSCFLFTDLANPTSNRIYRAIGYHPICPWQDYTFTSTLDT